MEENEKQELIKEVKSAISVEIKEETKGKITEINKAISDKFEELKKGEFVGFYVLWVPVRLFCTKRQ